MTTSWETRLRHDLHELADAPGPASQADRALAGARQVRRRRVVLAGACATTLAALLAIPVVIVGPARTWSLLPFGRAAGTPCESATDEAQPPDGVPSAEQPRFVRVVLTKLPPREDYVLQSAYGICALPDAPAGSIGELPNGYAVINLGPNREHGHLTVSIYHEPAPVTCDTLTTPPDQLLFCQDATATTPLVLAARTGGGPSDFVVTAIYPDSRAVSIGSNTTPLDVATVRSVVTDPALVELLP
jgi:hypothetical protein